MNRNDPNDDDNRGNDIQDVWLRCRTCSMEFLHSAQDQEFFARMGFLMPQHCKPCRRARKAHGAIRSMLIALAVLGCTVPAHAAVTIAHVATVTDASDSTTYTSTNQNIGTAAADRCVVVTTEGRKAVAASTTITSITIGGNAATILRQAQAGSASTNVVAVAALIVPSGTQATVVTTYDQTMARHQTTTFEMTGSTCTTASDTDISTAILSPTVNLDIPANGGAIGASANASASIDRDATWTNLTEAYETAGLGIESLLIGSGASAVFATTQTGLALTCTWSGSGQSLETVGVFVSWGPASAAPRRLLLMGVGN